VRDSTSCEGYVMYVQDSPTAYHILGWLASFSLSSLLGRVSTSRLRECRHRQPTCGKLTRVSSLESACITLPLSPHKGACYVNCMWGSASQHEKSRVSCYCCAVLLRPVCLRIQLASSCGSCGSCGRVQIRLAAGEENRRDAWPIDQRHRNVP
jgi:hypothetical protein